MSNNVDAIWAEMKEEAKSASQRAQRIGQASDGSLPVFRRKREKKPQRAKELSFWTNGGTAAEGSTDRFLYEEFTTDKESENRAIDNHRADTVVALTDWLRTSVPLVLRAAEEAKSYSEVAPPGQGLPRATELDKQLREKLLSRFKDSIAPDLADAALEFLLRPLVRLSLNPDTFARDTSRLAACEVLKNLLSSCGDAHFVTALPYVVPHIVIRLNCGDLDGVAGVPEKTRPSPEQKPQQMAHADGRELCEEVREQIADLIICLLGRVSGKPTVLVQSIDEIVSLVRGLMLDDFGKIKLIGCEACEVLCDAHAPLLLHFGEAMARSASSCLTHNHMQVRIAGLRAVTACLKTTTWKHSFDIIAHLTAWSDPNQVSSAISSHQYEHPRCQ
ncbi:hypothetical protein Pmar_PMAR020628 [Perkinsus marinus ATCC 50983]|uniref:Dynein axonemal assembly factor 5 TPR repeats domain-containing protein n=1 Tax=Perkinsus marinus (strain ATCC 50983 / TXsc) TaxID=423536 RepID=C5L7K3_PERM5|nr:hypothetical protein Pmar_PMAR020628 [Perkinsus marinus ATCC 50983]EER07465.1 hypothetical protein Pmar_PMAR020628 [Perkinsus marinus ATCC 50983]|eukprot:XP_002775649.1 hypothetical protein Pmar_PMAR020628 [Perkinsus marinus ATCC 50983]